MSGGRAPLPIAPGAAGAPVPSTYRNLRHAMLYTIAIVLVLLWILGLVSSYTMNGFIHVLLVIAIVVILVRVIQGRKPL